MKRILARRIGHALRAARFWAGATRAAFSSASMVSVALGGAIAVHKGFFNGVLFLLSAVGVLALHLGSNLVNDYYDYVCGADLARDGRSPFYGGGTVLVDGALRLNQVSTAYKALFGVALLSSLILSALRGPAVLVLGLGGFLCGYFYTAPPLRLSYLGLGEATIGLCFGPLTVLGSYLVQAGNPCLDAMDALVPSIPLGLLTAAIVFVNEFPDRATDAACGKRTLVVRFPIRTAIAGYSVLVLSPFLVIIAAIAVGLLPRATALTCLAVPIALLAIGNLRAAHDPSTPRHLHPGRVARISGSGRHTICCQEVASVSTIVLHAAVGLLLALGFTV